MKLSDALAYVCFGLCFMKLSDALAYDTVNPAYLNKI